MKQLFLFTLILAFASCKDAKKSGYQSVEPTSENEMAKEESHPGKKIMETECYICHNPKASQESMIAPPMIAVKRHYIDSTTTKEEFTESLILWITDPEAPSKMPGAQEKFGKMPYLPYPEETITQIAEYLYDYEIEKPKWFDSHFEVEHGKGKGMRKGKRNGMGKGKHNGMGKGKHKNQTSQQSENSTADIGLEYALATKSALGKGKPKVHIKPATLTTLKNL